MGLFQLEHSKSAYRVDFILYGLAVVGIAGALLSVAPHARLGWLSLLALTGLCAWSGMEYLLHRFVLHGMAPFQRWHMAHHERPTALICTPTLVSASLVLTLVFLPMWAALDLWGAAAITLGVMTGYLLYALTHHATHHWRSDTTWARKRKRWHALHHHTEYPGFYGVTTSLWDTLCGTDGRPR